MLYTKAPADKALKFESCGNLVSEDGFRHMRRTLDSYEFILVVEGTLFLTVEGEEKAVAPGQFLCIFPGQTHGGSRPSRGRLSFFWVHFLPDSAESCCVAVEDLHQAAELETQPQYWLPQCGTAAENSRVQVLFGQLLDIARRSSYNAPLCSYALSTMLLELDDELMAAARHTASVPAAQLAQWLQVNYDTKLSVPQIMAQFGYHPAYLAALFRKQTGQTVTEYLNRQRIRVAQKLLTQSAPMTMQMISEQVGFSDVKYFHRMFKRYVGITPTAFRIAFCEKHENRA